MKKKLILVMLCVVFLASSFVIWKCFKKTDDEKLKKQAKEVLEIQQPEESVAKEENAEVVEKIEQETVNEPEKTIDSTSSNKAIKEEPKNINNNQSQSKDSEDKSNKIPQNTESNVNNIPEVKNEPKVEEKIESKEDKELENLQRGLFKTEAEALQKGIEISLTDTVGISGSYCESVAYQGKIIGYKLYIRYSNGEYKIFMNE